MRLAIVTFSLFALAASPQAPANFAGEWIAISYKGDELARGFSVGTSRDGRMTITQDATTLAVSWISFSRNHKPVQALVNLDGSERRYVDRNSVEPQERTTRARWEGTQLVITTRWAGYRSPDNSDPVPVETEEVLVLESTSTLTVSVTRRFRDQVLRGTRTFRRQ